MDEHGAHDEDDNKNSKKKKEKKKKKKDYSNQFLYTQKISNMLEFLYIPRTNV